MKPIKRKTSTINFGYIFNQETGLLDAIENELKQLEKTKMWPQSKIFQLYWMSDKTLDEVANDIKISKSTTFLAVKRVRKYLKEVIDNPFKDV